MNLSGKTGSPDSNPDSGHQFLTGDTNPIWIVDGMPLTETCRRGESMGGTEF